MIQTESPYFQYTTATESPGVFSSSVGLFENDPVFPDDTCTATGLLCNFSWAVVIEATENLTIAGAGLYSWYDNYDQSTCVDAQNCQQRLVNNQGSNNHLYIWNLVTIGAVEMISDTSTGEKIYAANNTQSIGHPFWSILGAYLDEYAGDEDMTCLDDDTSAACYSPPTCDLTLSYSTLEDLKAASGSWPNICMDYYAIGTLYSMLDAALVNYTAANAGYDGVFQNYVDYTKEMVTSTLLTVMSQSNPGALDGGPGNQFFSCVLVEEPANSPTYTYNPCFVPWQEWVDLPQYTITYTLENSTGFWDFLSTNYGIQQSWVQFGTTRNRPACTGGSGGDDGGGSLDRRACNDVDSLTVGIPQPSSNISVSNPKDIITNALPSLADLQTTIIARQINLITGKWNGPTDDILQVISMPIFLVIQSVASMARVKAVGEQEAKEKKTALILEILGIVFAFIPFLDGLGLEIEGLDAVVQLIGAVGNTALAIQGIVTAPLTAPAELLGALTGGVEKDEEAMGILAGARRGISSDDLTKIGPSFQKMDEDFQAIIKHKCTL